MRAVVWTESAKLDYWNNIDYLENKWTHKEVLFFIDKTNHLVHLLSKQNILFKPTSYPNVFQVSVVKQILLFYRVSENESVVLLRFWNVLQDPKKLIF